MSSNELMLSGETAPIQSLDNMRWSVQRQTTREIEQVAYFKIETRGAAAKLRELIRLGGDAALRDHDRLERPSCNKSDPKYFYSAIGDHKNATRSTIMRVD